MRHHTMLKKYALNYQPLFGRRAHSHPQRGGKPDPREQWKSSIDLMVEVFFEPIIQHSLNEKPEQTEDYFKGHYFYLY